VKNIEYKIYPIGDAALTIEFENLIDEKLNQFILDFSQFIDNQLFLGIIETVPAYNSLSIFYNPNRNLTYSFLKNHLIELLINFEWVQENIERKVIEIPTIYDGEDIKIVSKYCKVSVEELIKIHSSPTYRVFMMGFLPGFAYLGGMNERISIPRKDTPRLKVPVGSVGIAGKQTGIYPLESPGGWQLIGRTELKLFDKNKSNPTLLKAGDLVKFIPI
jgi:inhibitor of KinA